MFLPENVSGFVSSFLYLIGSYSESMERRNGIPQIGNVYKKTFYIFGTRRIEKCVC
jgi:hypothetical protein